MARAGRAGGLGAAQEMRCVRALCGRNLHTPRARAPHLAAGSDHCPNPARAPVSSSASGATEPAHWPSAAGVRRGCRRARCPLAAPVAVSASHSLRALVEAAFTAPTAPLWENAELSLEGHKGAHEPCARNVPGISRLRALIRPPSSPPCVMDHHLWCCRCCQAPAEPMPMPSMRRAPLRRRPPPLRANAGAPECPAQEAMVGELRVAGRRAWAGGPMGGARRMAACVRACVQTAEGGRVDDEQRSLAVVPLPRVGCCLRRLLSSGEASGRGSRSR